MFAAGENALIASKRTCAWGLRVVEQSRGDFYAKDKVQTYSNAEKPLWACYELEEYPIMDLLDSSYEGMWRYRKLLPVEWDENIVSP